MRIAYLVADMSWVGLRDQHTADYRIAGLDRPVVAGGDIAGNLEAGSILLEFAAVPGDRDQILVDYRTAHPIPSRFQIRLDLNGVLSLHYRRGAFDVTQRLDIGLVSRSQSVTLRYTWDAPGEKSAMSVDIEETLASHFAAFDCALPLTTRDAVRLVMEPQKSQIGPGVKFFAIADHVMPHGALPSLAPRTSIQTNYRKKPVGDIAPGDLVVTQNGRTAQVRWSGFVDLPARGRFAPLRLCAPFHNATGDLICSFDQQIRMTGNVVEYLFATDQVSSKVGHLQYGLTHVSYRQSPIIRYAHFVLDDCVATDVSGVRIEGMNISHLQQNANLRGHSLLADLPRELLPLRNPLAPPLLHGYEAINLSKSQAA